MYNSELGQYPQLLESNESIQTKLEAYLLEYNVFDAVYLTSKYVTPEVESKPVIITPSTCGSPCPNRGIHKCGTWAKLKSCSKFTPTYQKLKQEGTLEFMLKAQCKESIAIRICM